MDFQKLTSRFRQFGGFRLLWEYAKLGVLWPAAKAAWRFTVKGAWGKVGAFQCCKEIYGTVILKKVEPFLEQKYAPVVQEFKKSSSSSRLEHKRSKVIWFCWLQGLNEAPEIVRVCYHSLTRHLVKVQGYRLQVIDGKNWKEFVKLPEYVVRKWEKGRIPAANFSDLLRLELLIKYGGTWIDSTVLCTGDVKVNGERLKVKEYLDANLFLFQYTPEGTTKGISISNWFITSCTNNEVLMAVRDMLYAYWKDYNCTIDYYMFHLFFEIVAREYPEQVGAMPYGCSQRSIALMRHWNEPFNQEQWDRLVSKVAFHKLSHRVSEEVRDNIIITTILYMIYEQGKDRFRIGKTYISCTNIPDAKERIAEAVKEEMNTYICVSNPRTVTYATKHADYREVMANSFMNLPDAEPMQWAAKLWGLKEVKRTMGPMVFKEMLSEPESGLKHFLLGDTDETLEKITKKFREEANANIVGTYSPPFCSLDEYDYEEMAKMINESGADLVWVSMRAPKQDFFATRILPYLDKKICIGVGAAFRFNLGEYKMAPPIIKKLGLMGLYWGKKNQTWPAFIWGYMKDNVPYLFYLAAIPFRRIFGKKYYE